MNFTKKISSSLIALLCSACCSSQILHAGICTTYDAATNMAHIPSVKIGEGYYWANLQFTGSVFRLTGFGEAQKTNAHAEFDASTMSVNIPCVNMKTSNTYRVDFAVKAGDAVDLTIAGVSENTGNIVINEILAKDASGGNDWVELYVKGSQSVNLSNYSLADADNGKSSLPSVTLSPGQFYLIQATDTAPTDGSAYVPFKLGATDSLILYEKEKIVDVFDWKDGDAPEGYSYGRLPDGTGAPQTLSPTPKATNLAASSTTTQVVLNKTSINIAGTGASAAGGVLTINSAGRYAISGSLTEGQIIVTADDSSAVTLVLNGINIHNSKGAPIYVKNAKETIIILADNTENYVSDGTSYTLDAGTDEPNAAVFSKDDLSISGSGSLIINANYNDGIASKDDLKISSGKITVSAVDDAIRGKNSLVITGGNLTLTASGQGLKSDRDEDTKKGEISIEKAQIQVTSGGDALNSTGAIVISSGELSLASGDDGMHADATLEINGGNINITKSYEGIESALITINDGIIKIVASDDGINAAGGNDSSGFTQPAQANTNQGALPVMNQGTMPSTMPPIDTFVSSGNYGLYINGGNIVVDATGDGIDINGFIEMTDGVVIVNGPLANDNGALDYDAYFKVSGGLLVAVGSSGMAMAPDTSSTQNSLLLNFTSTQQAGSLIHIQNSVGKDILTFAPSKNYQSLAFSSPNLATGTAYEVYTGGSSTGTVSNGLYQNGTYTAGTKYTSFTVAGVVTRVGATTGGNMGRF